MQPIGNAWQKLPRIVRDLANELGKQIELEMHGADTELDRQILDLIKDPLTHMVRNSADHGLEPPEERKTKGKPEKGTIKLSAYHEGGHIIIEITDDGRGLNIDKIRRKVLENGLATEAELDKMSESQIQKFIFGAGFSTAQTVTNVSGRGVGMDVVRTNIDAIGGTIDLRSAFGEGTTFTIKIPLTLAIVSALIVECAKNRFAIPQLSVVELVRAQTNSEHRIEHIKDTPVLRLRNKLLPLVHLKKLLNMDDQPASKADAENGFIVVTQVGTQTFGIVVDGVFHTEEIVVKPMSSKLRHITMFSGNTILGDGSVIMIIDPNGIASAVGSAVATTAQEAAADAEARRAATVRFRRGFLIDPGRPTTATCGRRIRGALLPGPAPEPNAAIRLPGNPRVLARPDSHAPAPARLRVRRVQRAVLPGGARRADGAVRQVAGGQRHAAGDRGRNDAAADHQPDSRRRPPRPGGL
ncbi:MAG: chemotaxis protein CheA, partial [Brevundimonas sp.]